MNGHVTFKLLDLVGDSVAIGNDEGREVYQKLSKLVDQHPNQTVFEISLEGMDATDASFPRESVVSLAKSLRGEKGFFLSGFKKQDIIDNWSYGAVAKDQPLMVINSGERTWIGPEVKSATLHLLEYIYDRKSVTTSMVAHDFDVSAQNASGKLKKLFNQGFILGSKEVAESGGHEFIYRAISF